MFSFIASYMWWGGGVSQIMTQYDWGGGGGGPEEAKIVWHNKWTAPNASLHDTSYSKGVSVHVQIKNFYCEEKLTLSLNNFYVLKLSLFELY